MDYLKFVEHHRNSDADITIGCLPCDYERATEFGLMKINDEGQIIVSLHCILLQPRRNSMKGGGARIESGEGGRGKSAMG